MISILYNQWGDEQQYSDNFTMSVCPEKNLAASINLQIAFPDWIASEKDLADYLQAQLAGLANEQGWSVKIEVGLNEVSDTDGLDDSDGEPIPEHPFVATTIRDASADVAQFIAQFDGVPVPAKAGTELDTLIQAGAMLRPRVSQSLIAETSALAEKHAGTEMGDAAQALAAKLHDYAQSLTLRA